MISGPRAAGDRRTAAQSGVAITSPSASASASTSTSVIINTIGCMVIIIISSRRSADGCPERVAANLRTKIHCSNRLRSICLLKIKRFKLQIVPG